MEAKIGYFLDTNAVIWLVQGEIDKFSASTKKIIQLNDIYVSPFVKLELQYLMEIKRVRERPDRILQTLYDEIGLQVHNIPSTVLVEAALVETWSRDPFDRVITAHARAEKSFLITRDKTILKNYSKAIW